jgi:ribosome-interacting GTPase 1
VALQEMLRTIPKHKGTEKMQADIKRRISRTRKEMARKSGPKKSSGIYIKKSGEGQVVLVGPPNSGKSEIVNKLTNAEPEVGDYPYTTRLPTPGMMNYENVQIQLVDLPPISEGYIESWLPQLIRVADAAMLVFSMHNDDILFQYDDVLEILERYKIKLYGHEEPEDLPRGIMPLQGILIANKMDTPHAKDFLEIFKEFHGGEFEVLEISTRDEKSLNSLRRRLFDLLELVRVYSKEPGKQHSTERPFVFRRGDTLHELAQAIHSDFTERLKTAKVWGAGKFDGQFINKDYVLQDEDIIELHIG